MTNRAERILETAEAILPQDKAKAKEITVAVLLEVSDGLCCGGELNELAVEIASSVGGA